MFSGYILACIITKGFICTSLFYVQCRVSMQSIQFAKRPKKLGEFYQNRNNLINIRKIRIVLDDVTKYRESKPKSYLIWFVWSITTKLNNYKRKLSLSWLAKTMNWMRSLEKVNSKLPDTLLLTITMVAWWATLFHRPIFPLAYFLMSHWVRPHPFRFAL